MALGSYGQILEVLDTITGAQPQFAVMARSLGARPASAAEDFRTILDSKNVLGVGIAQKNAGSSKTDELALTFYVRKKQPLRRLSAVEAVPPMVHSSLAANAAIPTDVVELGDLKPQVFKARAPVQPGNSIGHPDITAGTFGAVVKRGETLYALSNSHVLANSGKGKKGDVILYPGHVDGGKKNKDVIGSLTDFVKFQAGGDFVNDVDCAIAQLSDAALAKLVIDIRSINRRPSSVVAAKRGMEVEIVGRTSGHSGGEIRDINFRVRLNYGAGIGMIGFMDQVLCTRYTAVGDSGSLVFQKGTTKAVGLHFAGASGGSVFNPIGSVLKALKVAFA